MIVAIIGSRHFKRFELIKNKIDELEAIDYDLQIISGGARKRDNFEGVCVDEYIKEICEYNNITFNEKDYLPDRSKYKELGNKIYHDRNDKIINDADKVIAFWNGSSPGTRSVIYKCLERRKNIEVFFD